MITSCSKLPLAKFIRCTVHADFSVLGEGTEEERRAAWVAINSEFCDLVDDEKQRAEVDQGMYALQLAAYILRIRMVVAAMREYYHAGLKEILCEDFALEFDPIEIEQYEADLDRVMIELKMQDIELSQIEAMNAAKKQDQPRNQSNVSDGDFDDVLMEIYIHVIGAPVADLEEIKEKMMTATYARYINRLRKFYANPPKTAIPFM